VSIDTIRFKSDFHDDSMGRQWHRKHATRRGLTPAIVATDNQSSLDSMREVIVSELPTLPDFAVNAIYAMVSSLVGQSLISDSGFEDDYLATRLG
jgi:hypothetical protein